MKQSFSSKFDEETTANASSSEDSREEGFESIREKKKTKTKRKTEEGNFNFNNNDPDFADSTMDSSSDYFKDEQLRNEIEKQKNISKFLYVKIPAPRSPRMVDRLNLKNITVGKGKIFGPEDYMSFTFLTILIIIFFLDRQRQYKTFSFENLENVNIYNALKPSEVVKIYEDNEISPTEQVMMNSKEHVLYKEMKAKDEMKSKIKLISSHGRINDVPKLDIKQQFKDSIKDTQKNSS